MATAAFGTSGRWFAAAMCYFDLYAAGVGCMIITAHSLNMIVFTLTGYEMGDANSKVITAIVCKSFIIIQAHLFRSSDVLSVYSHCLHYIHTYYIYLTSFLSQYM